MTALAFTNRVPRFSEGVLGVLQMLFGAEGRGELQLAARTLDGVGYQEILVRVLARDLLPSALIELLEGRRDWYVEVRSSVYDGQHPSHLSCVFARARFSPVFQHQWLIPDAQITAMETRLAAFPLRPSGILDGVSQVLMLWRLSAPISLKTAADRAAALELQRRLALALGASTADCRRAVPSHAGLAAAEYTITDHDPAGFMPLAGPARNLGTQHRRLVGIAHLDGDAVYTRAQLEAALKSMEATHGTRG